jgi:hypothetical protein
MFGVWWALELLLVFSVVNGLMLLFRAKLLLSYSVAVRKHQQVVERIGCVNTILG